MDHWHPVKEEYIESSSSQSNYSPGIMVAPPLAVAMEGLHDTGPPPFLTKTFDMVDDPRTDGVVSWSRGGESIVVWDVHAFSNHLLPRHFKHSNFSSFIRQLNTYGFRKIDPDRWEFANELFLKGHKHLLKNITRRKSTTSSSSQQQQEALLGPCVEVGRFEPENEVDRLRRDKHVLFMELVKLKQQQKDTRAYLQTIELQLQGTEQRQQHMMSFLAKAMQNPEFVQQLVQYKERKKQLEESITNKRRRPIDQEGPSTFDYRNLNYGYNQESELETLALEMQGFRRPIRVQEEEVFDRSEVDGGFWDELLGNEEQVFDELETLVELDEVEEEKEDVNVLADRLGFLGSSLK